MKKRTGIAPLSLPLLGFLILLPWVKLEIFPRFVWADVLFLSWGVLLYLQWAAGQRTLRKPPWPVSVFGVLLVLWIMAVLVSGFNASHPQAYIFEAAAYFYLAVLSWLLAYILSISPSTFVSSSKALNLILFITSIFGLIGILEAILLGKFSPIFYNNAQKLIATFKYPNQLAGFLVLFLPLMLEQFLKSKNLRSRLLFGSLTFLMLIEVVASGSRTGVVAAFFGLGLRLSFNFIRLRLRGMIFMSIIIVVSIVAITYLKTYVWTVHRALSAFEVIASGEITDPFRVENWTISLKLFNQYPITGYGVANVALDFGYEIHNTYLAVAAETGTLGILTFLGLWSFTLFLAWQNTRLVKRVPQWTTLAFGLWFGLLAEWLYATQHHILRTRHLWVALALVVALNAILRRELTKKEKQGAG